MTQSPLSLPSRRVASALLLRLAQFGYAQAFFGNLYEAVVRIPDRLADSRDLAAAPDESVGLHVLLRRGSPVRYHLPGIPIMVGGTVGALAAGWGARHARPWFGVAGASVAVAGVVTARIIRDVNLKLFFASAPPSSAERDELLRTWYRLNMVRLAAVAAAWTASDQARARLRRSPTSVDNQRAGHRTHRYGTLGPPKCTTRRAEIRNSPG